MASPTRFLSGRQQEQKIGIEGSTGNQKVLEVVGQVGIGTTIFETRTELDVRGNAVVSGILTVGDIVVSSGVGGVFAIEKLRVTGISTFVGIGTFENNLFVGGDLDVDGHTELDDVNVSGASTFTGAIDANGSLDVNGLTELDDVNVSGASTFTGAIDANGSLDVNGHTELDNLNVSGVSTFAGAIDANGSLDVDGHTELDDVNVSGASTFTGIGTFLSDLFVSGDLNVVGDLVFDSFTARKITVNENSFLGFASATTLNVSGVSTFTGAIDANGSLDVNGHTELDNLNVSGVSTFASAIFTGVGSAVTISSSGINVAAGIITGTLDNNLTLNTSGTGLSGIATYNNSGVVTFTVASNATDANTASTIVSRNGSGNFSAGTISADLTGVASTATKLATARTFELTGDVVASQISFDGTGNVSLAATIQPNPTISGNVTIGNDLQVNNNLNVSGNITVGGTSATLFTETLRVKDADIVLGFTTNSAGNEVSTDTTANNGGIAIASTEGSPIVSFNVDNIPSTYKNIMWFKTNAFTGLNTDAWLTNYAFGVGTTSMSAGTKFAVGNIETDFDDIKSVRHIKSSGIITASSFSGDGSGLSGISGGTAFAENSANQSQTIPFYVSTATTDVAGVSTQSFVFNPSTKSLGIGTGAPTSNLHVEGNVNITGVSTFSNNIDANGDLDVDGHTELDDVNVSGASTFTGAIDANGSLDVNGLTELDDVNVSGASTFAGAADFNGDLDVDGHTELDNLNVSGVSTFASAVNINSDLDVDGHTELDNVNVSGVSTFSDDVRFVGVANTDVVWDKSANSLNFEDYAKATFGDGGDLTITHSSNQSSISESSGNGLEVKSVKVTITPNGSTEKMAEFNANSSVELYFDDSKKLETTGYGITVTGDVNTSNNISIAGVSTFAGAIDANGSLDVDGHTELDDVNVSGASTFTGAIDANGSLDVNGLTELDDVNVSGASTFTGAIDANGDLDVDGHTELDNLNVSGVSTFTGAIDANGSLDVDGHTELDDLNVSGVSTFASAIVGSAVTISSSGINAATGIITASSLDAAISEWVLGADGTDNYTFSGPGFTGAENDPTIYVVRGQKYNFENKMGAHPFRIQSTPNGSTGTQYNDGITNNDVSNGTLVWDVQFDAPEILYYQCTSHPDMGGIIYTRSSAEDPANFNKVIVGAATTITGSGINAPTGIITASTFSGSGINVTGVVTATSTVTNSVVIGTGGTGVTINSSGINVTGVVTATSFSGSGASLTGISADSIGAISGITVREEGSVAGSASSVGDINFVSSNLTATASGIGATVTLSDTPTFTSTVIGTGGTGVTINSSGINAATGIITATSFVGNLTGTASAASGLSTTISINTSGIITATSFSGSGANLTNLPAPESSGDKYNTGITTSVYVSITGGIGTAQAGLTTVAANNDIFIGPGIAYSFPSTAGKSYIIESIHVTNIYNTQLYFTSRHDFNGGENVPTAQRVIVPYQGALEVLEEPIVAKPSDILRFQAFTGVGITATGVNNGLDSFITYSEKTDTNFIGTGKTVVTPAGTELFTSNTNPSVIQSIRLCNYDLDFDVDASVSIYRGGSVGGILTTGVRQGYLVYNLTVPKNSVIEILERPKYLAANDTVVVGIAGTTLTNSLSSTLFGKYIT